MVRSQHLPSRYRAPLAGLSPNASGRANTPRRADPPINLINFSRLRPARLGRLAGSISPTAVDAIAQAIQTQEGYYPGSLAYQNNNPGNLVYAGQPGASPGAGGFAAFSSYSAGYAALQNQITLDATRGTDVNGNPTTTIAQLISSWAPPSENDTNAYIASVTAQTGYDPNAPLSSLGQPLITPATSPVSTGASAFASLMDSAAAAPGDPNADDSSIDLGDLASSDLSSVASLFTPSDSSGSITPLVEAGIGLLLLVAIVRLV